MVGTIIPIVHGERESGQHAISGWLHLAGALLSGAAAGAVVGALGTTVPRIPDQTVALLIGTLALAYSAHELKLVSLPMPQFRRQVPRSWSLYPPRVTALLYGLGLGWGFGTFMTSSAFYVLVVWAFLSRDPIFGAWLLGIYGLFRGVPIVGLSAVPQPERVYRFHAAITGATVLVKVLGGLVMAFLGAAVVAGTIAG